MDGRRVRVTSTMVGRLIAYSLGMVISGAICGVVASWLGLLVEMVALHIAWVLTVEEWALAIAIVALAYSAQEVAVLRLPMPQVPWQVPVEWRRYGRAIQMFLYGVVLGADVFTWVPYASFYLLVLCEAALGLQWGPVLGAAYAAMRAASMAGGAFLSYRRRDPGPVFDRVLALRPAFHISNAIILAAMGEILLGGLILFH